MSAHLHSLPRCRGLATLLTAAVLTIAPPSAAAEVPVPEVSESSAETTEPGVTTESGATETTAPPETGAPRVKIEPLHVEGERSAPFEARVIQSLHEGLRRADFVVLDGSAPDQAAADYAVRARLQVSSRNYRIHLELVDDAGASLAALEDRCELCGVAEAEQMVADQAALLADKLAPLVRAIPVLVIDSEPPGATIELDGTIMGTAPLVLPVAAGRHRTSARLPGHFDQRLEVDAVEGMRQSVTLQLIAIPEEPDPERSRRAPLMPWGLSSAVAGAASLGTGVTLLVLDERPYARQCSGPDVDADGDCRLRYDTLAGGIAATVSGVLLGATAITLITLARRRRGDAPRRSAIFRSGIGRHGLTVSR